MRFIASSSSRAASSCAGRAHVLGHVERDHHDAGGPALLGTFEDGRVHVVEVDVAHRAVALRNPRVLAKPAMRLARSANLVEERGERLFARLGEHVHERLADDARVLLPHVEERVVERLDDVGWVPAEHADGKRRLHEGAVDLRAIARRLRGGEARRDANGGNSRAENGLTR